MTKLIIYDFDMTLVDSRAIGKKILKDLEELLGLDLSSICDEYLWGGTFIDVITLIHQKVKNRRSFDEIKGSTVAYAINRYKEQEIGGLSTLQYFQRKGIKQAIVSQNALSVITACLSAGNNSKIIFDPVYDCGERTKYARIEQIAREVETPKEDILVVGDRPEDIVAGNYAHIRTVGITTGLHSKNSLKRYNPHHIIKTLTQLREVVN